MPAESLVPFQLETVTGVYQLRVPENWKLKTEADTRGSGYSTIKFIDQSGSVRFHMINVLCVRDTSTPVRKLQLTRDGDDTTSSWDELIEESPMFNRARESSTVVIRNNQDAPQTQRGSMRMETAFIDDGFQ